MLFLKALVLGLAVAAPLGPIGALCIARTLQAGFMAGMAGGFGTALADALYAGAAAFGFTAAAGLMEGGAGWVRVIGGVLLLGLGLRALLSPAREARPVHADTRTILSTAAATFALTLANPSTILSFAAMFAGLGLADSPGIGTALSVVLGVFLGSLAWWAVLSGAVALTRHRLPRGFALWVQRLSGVLLLALGGWALWGAF